MNSNNKKEKELGGNRRVLRVEREVMQVVAMHLIKIQSELTDQVPVLVTVTRVQMPADLKQAKVYVSFFNHENENQDDEKKTDAQNKKAIEFLQRNAPHFQDAIAHQLRMKFCPRLTFYLDQGLDKVIRIEKLIKEIANEKTRTDTDQ